MMKPSAIKLIQVPASQDETQQALLLLALNRLQRRASYQFILSFLGHERLDEFNLGFLFDVQDGQGPGARVGITGLGTHALQQFVSLNLNLQFPYYHLEAVPALTGYAASQSRSEAGHPTMEISNHG